MKSKQKKSFIGLLGGIGFALLLIACHSNVKNDPVAQLPRVISISDDINTIINSSFTVSVSAEVTDTGNLSYKWMCAADKISEGNVVDTANNANLSLTADKSGQFYYYCIITNTLGSSIRSTFSPRVKITVNESLDALPAVILSHPDNYSSKLNDSFSFSVSAYAPDKGKLAYQWFYKKDLESETTKIDNENNSRMEGIITTENLGYYYCEIINTIEDNGDGGKKSVSINTNTVVLSNNIVNANTPVIINALDDDTIVIPSIKIYEVDAYSIDEGTLSYQWYSVLENEDEVCKIENATSNKLRLDVTELGKHGYYCEITNSIDDNGDGGLKSVCIKTETAWLDAIYLESVVAAPVITVQPAKISVVPFDTQFKISCIAESYEGDVTYRWYESLDGTTQNGMPVPNAFSSTLLTPRVTQKGSHYYYCVVANNISSENISQKSAVTFSNVVEVAYTGLPLLQIDTVDGELPTCEYISREGSGGKTITNATKVPSRMQIFEAGNSNAIYDSGDYVAKKSGCTIKIRGNTSAYGSKKPYKIKLQKKADLLEKLIGRSGKQYSDKDWVLLKCGTNLKTCMGYAVSDLLNATWTPKYSYVDVVLNGDYRGIYILIEAVKDSEARINIDETGYIFECDGYFWNEDVYFHTNTCKLPFTFKYPDSDEITDEQIRYIKAYMNNFEYNLNKYENYIDYESFARTILIHDILGTYDSGGANVYFSKFDNTENSKVKMEMPWDLDSILYSYNSVHGNTDCFSVLHDSKRTYATYLFNNDNKLFVESYKAQWENCKDSLYSDYMIKMNELKNSVGDEIDFSRYCDAKKYSLTSYNTVQDDIDVASEYLQQHLYWLDTAIEGL